MITQLLFNGRMATGELNFQECITKSFLKEKISQIGKFSNMVTILRHDTLVISNDLNNLFKNMNLIPALALCMVNCYIFQIYYIIFFQSSDYIIQSPLFTELFFSIRSTFITILKAKGGVTSIGKCSDQTKLLLHILDYLQNDLKTYETENSLESLYHEDSFLGLFEYGSNDTKINILNYANDYLPIDDQHKKNKIKIGLYARQLSLTIKYIATILKVIDRMYVKYMAFTYDKELINLLIEIAYISSKNRIAMNSLKCVLNNDYAMKLFVNLMNAKTIDDIIEKCGEIALILQILYNGKFHSFFIH